MKIDPRTLSLEVLIELSDSDYTLDRILENNNEKFEKLDLRDVALSKNLIFGVLRWQLRIDYIISEFSNTPLKKIDNSILNILRLGIYQIYFLDKIPESAAVNTSVEMSKEFYGGKFKGFVNGILRSSIREREKIVFPDIKKDPVKHISVKYSFPEWLVKTWIDEDGVANTVDKCAVINEIPKITILPNSLKTSRDELIKLLGDEVSNISKSQLSTSLSFTNPKMSIPELPGFKEGFFKVQDEAAQIVCEFLEPKETDSVLDACAGIGGKTGTLSFLMNNKGSVTACDNVKFKLDQLDNEMERLSISNVKTLLCDLSRESLDSKYDRILIDAPCSGAGVIRRNPDAKWTLSHKKIKKNASLQLKILTNISKYLKDDGIMVYTVCSTEKEENETVLKRFLKNNSDFEIDSFSFNNPEKDKLIKDGKYLKTSVLDNGMDGFFAVRLKKRK